MRIIKFIEGSRIYLRPCAEEDAEPVQFGKNHPDSKLRALYGRPCTITIAMVIFMSWEFCAMIITRGWSI